MLAMRNEELDMINGGFFWELSQIADNYSSRFHKGDKVIWTQHEEYGSGTVLGNIKNRDHVIFGEGFKTHLEMVDESELIPA